jgi:hypothetical protein
MQYELLCGRPVIAVALPVATSTAYSPSSMTRSMVNATPVESAAQTGEHPVDHVVFAVVAAREWGRADDRPRHVVGERFDHRAAITAGQPFVGGTEDLAGAARD